MADYDHGGPNEVAKKKRGRPARPPSERNCTIYERIERVYFAVIGQGFRQDNLDKLTGYMAGTPIRSAVFIESAALMRLVNDSIAHRREFRLADIDRLLFGNKIIDERG